MAEPKGYRQRQECRDKARVWLEAATLVAVVVYAALTFCLLKSAQKQARDADIAATEARNANAQSAEFFALSQRPWIAFTDAQLSPSKIAVGPYFTVSITIENTGSSPAQTVTMYADAVFSNLNMSEHEMREWIDRDCAVLKQDAQQNPRTTNDNGFVLVPKAKHTKTLNVGTFSSDKSIPPLYVIGCIDYTDNGLKPHKTRFCQMLSQNTQTFDYCPSGNSAD